MKSFIIVFALAFICASAEEKRGPPMPPKGGPPGGHGGPPEKGPGFAGPWENIPGCNMSTYPKGVNGSQCCASKPGCVMKMNETFDEACKTECSKSDNKSAMWCCFTKCALTKAGVISADGTFDGPAVVAKLTAATNKSDVWSSVIQSVVDECIAEGPKLFNDWLNMTKKNSTCDVAINKAIEQCIKRQLFLQCPDSERNSSANCSQLFAFAKACPAYPFFQHDHGKGEGHGKDGKGEGHGKGGKGEGHGKDGKGDENGKGQNKEKSTTGSAGDKTTTAPSGLQYKAKDTTKPTQKAAPTKPAEKTKPTQKAAPTKAGEKTKQTEKPKPTPKGATTTVKSG